MVVEVGIGWLPNFLLALEKCGYRWTVEVDFCFYPFDIWLLWLGIAFGEFLECRVDFASVV